MNNERVKPDAPGNKVRSDRLWHVFIALLAIPTGLIVMWIWDVLKIIPNSNATKQKQQSEISTEGPGSIATVAHNSIPTRPVKNSVNYRPINNTVEKVVPVSKLINRQRSFTDIAILVLNDHNAIDNSLGSSIASLYNGKGLTTTISLFTPGFLQSDYFQKVKNGDSEAIQTLGLPANVKFVIIGNYVNEFENGDYTKYISRAKLSVSIVPVSSAAQITSFELRAANGYDDKDHAEQGALEKLLTDYEANHLNLN